MTSTKNTTDFLAFLEKEAAFQAKLHKNRYLPKAIDGLSALVGRYSWQVVLAASGLTALVIELWKVSVFR